MVLVVGVWKSGVEGQVVAAFGVEHRLVDCVEALWCLAIALGCGAGETAPADPEAMVQDAARYRWSSYRQHAHGESDPVLTEHPVYAGLSVAPEDIGKVIGKDGRTAQSIRVLLNAAASKYGGGRAYLDIVD